MATAVYIPVWRLRQIIGLLKAERLLAAHGGTKVYLAVKQREGGKLARAIGMDAAQALADEYCTHSIRTGSRLLSKVGATVELPNGSQGTKDRLRARTTLLAEDSDLTAAEIARRLGISERTVRRHRARARAANSEFQACNV